MRESRGISVFKAISRQGPKANSVKVKPEHLGWSNEQDQNNVQVGRNPGNLSSQHGQFFPSFCNCIFHATGYKLIDLVCQKLIFSGFSGYNVPS